MISTETVAQVVVKLGVMGPGDDALQSLRKQFPEIHFTYCMDDDVCGPTAAFESEKFNLYYIDGRDHCLAFTNQAEIATGIVVAEVSDDD